MQRLAHATRIARTVAESFDDELIAAVPTEHWSRVFAPIRSELQALATRPVVEMAHVVFEYRHVILEQGRAGDLPAVDHEFLSLAGSTDAAAELALLLARARAEPTEVNYADRVREAAELVRRETPPVPAVAGGGDPPRSPRKWFKGIGGVGGGGGLLGLDIAVLLDQVPWLPQAAKAGALLSLPAGFTGLVNGAGDLRGE